MNDIKLFTENTINFTVIDGKLQEMTPANTLITFYKPDMTVDRKATIKSFTKFYTTQIATKAKRRVRFELMEREWTIPALQRI